MEGRRDGICLCGEEEGGGYRGREGGREGGREERPVPQTHFDIPIR